MPSLTAYDSKGQPIPVAWSNTTDDFGNVSKRANLVGITDEKTVYVRRTDGKPFQYAHSFRALIFDDEGDRSFRPGADFARGLE
ncbi:MAG: hypothetical protein AB7G68_11030 [Nitrospiraceae bacterium]